MFLVLVLHRMGRPSSLFTATESYLSIKERNLAGVEDALVL
jgi:hypothetical protein